MKGYLFDLDGTLLNSLEDIADSMNYALKVHGLPIEKLDAYRYHVGSGAKILAQRASKDQGTLGDKVHKTYQAYYETHNLIKTRPYEGILETLLTLKAQGKKLSVFSNKPHDDTVAMVKHFFPDNLFQVVRGQVKGIPVKPDPKGALLVAKDLALAPEDMGYLGDTGVDMACAVASGMTPIGVTWGFRDQLELEENGAKVCIHRPEELLNMKGIG